MSTANQSWAITEKPYQGLVYLVKHVFLALGSAKGSERRDFLQEIDMMKKVSEGQNPHVVSMVACVTVQEPLSLISEFVPFGNLLQYLRANQKMVS